MRDITARFPQALEAHPRIAALDAVALEELAGRGDEAGMENACRVRTCALLLDEAFVAAGCERALEPHPRLPLMDIGLLWSLSQRGEMASVLEWAKSRHQEIELEERDRYRYGWRGDPGKSRELGGGWKRAVDQIAAVKKANPRAIPKILCMGGNGSSKSEFGAWYACKLMVEKAGAQVAVLCPSQTQARKVLMSRLFDNLPFEWRPAETGKSKSGITGNISYTRKMGFTENTFILPNGSRCTFYFYLDGDPLSIEGDQLDVVLADEEVPVEWLEACEYRLARTGGTLMALFTPISGYIPTVSWFRGVARVVESREAPLLREVVPASEDERDGLDDDGPKTLILPPWLDGPPGAQMRPVRLPVVEHGADYTRRIIYFWTQDCCYPADSYETLVELLRSNKRGANEVKTRAYGIACKVKDARFPLLNVAAHAITLARAQSGEVPKAVTWYHLLDPASGRNHVMQWWAKTADGREICVREWPQQDDFIPGVGQPGPWAVDAKKGKLVDGVRGPAQEPFGLTTKQYAAEIRRVEVELAKLYEGRTDGEPVNVMFRLMDSRALDTVTHGRSYYSEFAAEKIYFRETSGQALNPRSDNPDAICGVNLISDALGYNVDAPLSMDNRPRMLIVYEPADADAGKSVPKGCGNTWDSLQNWTGADGLKGARKDFIDLCHYAQRAEMRHIPPRAEGMPGGGGWGGY